MCLILSICYAQDLTIIKYEGYDCSIGTNIDGACENKFIYKYKFVRNKKKIKQTDYNEIKIHKEFREDKFQTIDSINIHNKNKYFKLIDFRTFAKMLEIITHNDTNKLIILDSNYFLNKKYINSHTKIEVQDTISKIKNYLVKELETFSFSTVIKRIIVNVSYKNESYKFVKSDMNTFWHVYNSKSDELCRFINPEWNIMINNLLNTKKSYKNDLQIIKINSRLVKALKY